jgi:ornithine carbamoyltransferase
MGSAGGDDHCYSDAEQLQCMIEDGVCSMPNANRHFLTLHDAGATVLHTLILRAQEMQRLWTARTMPSSLAGRRVALIVDDDGWRNTFAFDLGIQTMGGLSVKAPVHLGTREDTADLAAYLGNWADAVVVRTPSLENLRALAHAAAIPVINARTHQNHPCETLGDLAFIYGQRGTLEGLNVVAVAPDANILRSWVEVSAILPIRVTQIYPEQWHVVEPGLLHAKFSATSDMNAVREADVVITDTWPKGADGNHLGAYRISSAVLDQLHDDALFIPCPPVHRGEEVSEDGMTHPTCKVIAAKAFLLHAQNALLEWILSA